MRRQSFQQRRFKRLRCVTAVFHVRLFRALRVTFGPTAESSLNLSKGLSKYFQEFHTDYAGSTPATARNVGTLAGTRAFDDWTSGPFGGVISDTSDVYKFTLASARKLTAKMRGAHDGQDLNLQLFVDKNHDGVLTANEMVASSNNRDSPNEQIIQSMAAGTYFLLVVGINGETNYHLTLTA